MPTLRRRSSRLAGNATPSKRLTSKLTSLLEREETPGKETSLDTIVSPTQTMMPGAFVAADVPLKTPETVGCVKADHREMHPSKVHQSTAKTPDSGLRLGFTNINGTENTMLKTVDSTPSKSNIATSPRFNFMWTRPESDLSSEAQRIMESVRLEAARIKEKMKMEQDEQKRKDSEADRISGRKIAKPKAGRFSDAHKAEFKKMESISNHASLWKNKLQPLASSAALKRTKSRADLRGENAAQAEGSENPMERSGKRVKKSAADDVSTARPQSSSSAVTAPGYPEPPSSHHAVKSVTLPSVVTTPTKASLARANSVKSMRLTKLPTLSRSKTTLNITSPAPPKTEGNNKYFSALARAPSMKSILHRSKPKFSDDPQKIAAGTHLPAPKVNPSNGIEEGFKKPDFPATHRSTLLPSPSIKRVGFKLDLDPATTPADLSNSPSPSRIPSRVAGPLKSPSKAVLYPFLQKHDSGPLNSNPPGPGDFTFRSSKPVNFGPASSGLTSPSIRQVRPSGIVTPVTALDSLPSVAHGVPNKKRRRIDEEADEIENVDPNIDGVDSSPKKKQKMQEIRKPVPTTPKKRSMFTKQSASTTKVKKGGLSLSRLNMLARPKERR